MFAQYPQQNDLQHKGIAKVFGTALKCISLNAPGRTVYRWVLGPQVALALAPCCLKVRVHFFGSSAYNIDQIRLSELMDERPPTIT